MARADRRRARQCPNGHTMDPNWKRCPYCDAVEKANQRTSHEEVLASSSRKRTRVEKEPQKSRGRETKLMPPMDAHGPGVHSGKGDKRRIMGVLITYTWVPEGQLFKVREGKTFIGRDKVASDASHQPCDVQIVQDDEMSAEHAVILYRNGKYHISDNMTTNGTFLDEKELNPNSSTELSNYAKIRTGKTLWTFIKIDAPPPSEVPKKKPDQDQDTKTPKNGSRKLTKFD